MRILLALLFSCLTACGQFNLLDQTLISSATGCAVPWVAPQPVAVTAITNETISFTAVGAGTIPFGYRWQSNSVNMENVNGYLGVYTPTLWVSNCVMAQSNWLFRCIITNICGSITSSAVALTVQEPGPLTSENYTNYEVASATTLTLTNFVCPSIARCLLVHVHCADVSTACSGVTYGGLPMTLLDKVDNAGVTNYLFGKTNAAASGDIVVSMGGVVRIDASALSFSGAHLYSPFGYPSNNIAPPNSSECIVTNASAVGEIVVNFFTLTENSSSLRPTSAMTKTNYNNWLGSYRMASAQTNGAATVVHGWLLDTPDISRAFILFGIPIKP